MARADIPRAVAAQGASAPLGTFEVVVLVVALLVLVATSFLFWWLVKVIFFGTGTRILITLVVVGAYCVASYLGHLPYPSVLVFVALAYTAQYNGVLLIGVVIVLLGAPAVRFLLFLLQPGPPPAPELTPDQQQREVIKGIERTGRDPWA